MIPPILRRSLLSLAVLTLAACDKMYEAHVSVTLSTNATRSAESVAEDLISHLGARFDVHCDPPRACEDSTPSSPCAPEVQRDCSSREDNTAIQIVTTGNQLTVDLSRIAGLNEPKTFRALRLATEEHLRQSVPEAIISVEYPAR